MSITLERVCKKNIDRAVALQHSIFPQENGSRDIRNSVNNEIANYFSMQKHWIVKVDERDVGITGFYAYNDYPLDAWLAWFGIIKSERRKGYASAVFKKMLEKSKKKGYKTFRLYTDEVENSDAVCFYNKMGMTSEIYNNKKDVHREIGNTLIFSIGLGSNPVSKWDNKYLYLSEHDKLNNIK